ncbi:Cysteine-rich CPCC domain-containing protein [Candidatus Magnetomoraceae bacterium gMMP-15]
MINEKDHLERRCPRLGGSVNFEYCRSCGDCSDACFKILDCWWERFDVVRFLRNNLPDDQFNSILNARPRPKVNSLIELIEQAKRSVE